jgi:quercetin dioxygenase-like cupin family protein
VMSAHVPLEAARVVETPAAAMRTYASPSGAASAQLSVWRTEMAPGSAGPLHSIDHDHVVVVLAGRLDAEVDGERIQALPGDCVVLTAGAPRRLTASDVGVVMVTSALPGSTATAGDADPVLVPWAN